ncbi:hypothetical protein SAMD00019534_101550 [Acytostelium subglobosum LB1]|uniref:hypothetical protein n=1 Tax=Acytostelium subglobosum LB1 TaxID=1410327 RepID=UPI000644A5DC|nr:hypothetical protein SAMD00019534_101550 [Acytostelium subglobosum LB1]GAM26980.1 hypothetical protein SAMD00019534_101550 [Acytostelium subglobosum LB1]|eukprot:XP_012750248.1 hypothetical protein SAMD00019534_101550 [Acytostelium subglobosum LB1]
MSYNSSRGGGGDRGGGGRGRYTNNHHHGREHDRGDDSRGGRGGGGGGGPRPFIRRNIEDNAYLQLRQLEREKQRVENNLEHLEQKEKLPNYTGNKRKELHQNGAGGGGTASSNSGGSSSSSSIGGNVNSNINSGGGDTRTSKMHKNILGERRDAEATREQKKEELSKSTDMGKQRSRVVFGMLNRTLMDFQKDIKSETAGEAKRKEVEKKIEDEVRENEAKLLEAEKKKVQDIKEKELKHHEEIILKQEELYNNLMTRKWDIHKKMLDRFPLKTVTEPQLFFTLSRRAPQSVTLADLIDLKEGRRKTLDVPRSIPKNNNRDQGDKSDKSQESTTTSSSKSGGRRRNREDDDDDIEDEDEDDDDDDEDDEDEEDDDAEHDDQDDKDDKDEDNKPMDDDIKNEDDGTKISSIAGQPEESHNVKEEKKEDDVLAVAAEESSIQTESSSSSTSLKTEDNL